MKGYLTTFVRVFSERPEGAPEVESIEIPLIQRDYAQGRTGPVVEEIRTNFVEVLLDAVAGGQPEGLDFVYGKVDRGVLQPLDGQQRLTTLFLLHWFLSSRAGQLEPQSAWTRFSYATRFSARRFCERLVENALPSPLPPSSKSPSEWITDQPWYLHVWRDDPTIKSMLGMIDAIAAELDRLHPDLDPSEAWKRLMDNENPAITFYLLPIDDMESEEDLYIKMNSRGKPLTPFETFKARFEKDISHSLKVDELGRRRSESFAHKIDGDWSNLFWKFHGGDNLVDDEFVRYIDFLTQVCELREGRLGNGRIGERARDVFGAANARADEHLDFLFAAFDCWQDADGVAQVFDDLFSTATPGSVGYDPTKVIVFSGVGRNLFELCLRHFDSQAKRNPNFTLQQTLLLHAVLLHLTEKTDGFPARLRVLRNLVSAPGDEVRGDRMPALLGDVETLIRTGNISGLTRFSTDQLADELRKQGRTDSGRQAAIHRLEDHDLLRGSLGAFDVGSDAFEARALTFERVFTDRGNWRHLTGALLATGDYQRRHSGSTDWQFGALSSANEGSWRYLFAEGDTESMKESRSVLATFLDRFEASGVEAKEYCQSLMETWVSSRENHGTFDWRYYLMKHEYLGDHRYRETEESKGGYRTGRGGMYRGELGYSMIMLRETRRSEINRDPILLSVWELAQPGDRSKNPWFGSDVSAPRWIELVQSGAGVRNVEEGFELRPPEIEELRAPFIAICNRRGDIELTGSGALLRIPQVNGVDEMDRVVLGANILRELIAAGL